MPFHFNRSESPAKAVRRVCDECVREAGDCLKKSRRPAAIHKARKEIKKLRATLRLVRWQIGRDDYRKTVKLLRRVAERLAAARDARVEFRALEKLAGDSGSRFPKLHKILRKKWRYETRRLRRGDSLLAAERFLKKTGRSVGKLEIAPTGWLAVEPGLKQTYLLGRVAWQAACQTPSAEHFHAWRKQVKNLWYQLQLLCPAWPTGMRSLVDMLETLGEQLGDEHDLVLLKQFVAEHCADEAGEAAALGELIEAQKKKLRAAALESARALYVEAPSAFCSRLEIQWNAWRGD